MSITAPTSLRYYGDKQNYLWVLVKHFTHTAACVHSISPVHWLPSNSHLPEPLSALFTLLELPPSVQVCFWGSGRFGFAQLEQLAVLNIRECMMKPRWQAVLESEYEESIWQTGYLSDHFDALKSCLFETGRKPQIHQIRMYLITLKS